jgi:hypothetical protein
MSLAFVDRKSFATYPADPGNAQRPALDRENPGVAKTPQKAFPVSAIKPDAFTRASGMIPRSKDTPRKTKRLFPQTPATGRDEQNIPLALTCGGRFYRLNKPRIRR